MPNLTSELNQVKQLEPKRKIALLVLLLLLLAGGFVLGSIFLRGKPKSQPTPVITPSPTSKPATSLSLSPATGTFKVGQAQTLSVVLNQEPVEAVDVVLEFDPKVFTVSNLTNGEVFPEVLREKIENGKLIFSASLAVEGPTEEKTGQVFSFTLTPKMATASSIIDFHPQETITAKGGVNTLGLTVGGRYQIQ